MVSLLLKVNGEEKYEKYRWFYTSSGKLVIGGKNSSQNEEIMKRVKKDEVIMHTSSPGSPFCIIRKPNKRDIEETAIFTACFSQEWKKGKKKTEVHIFKGEQVIKKKDMKEGTFGILGSVNKEKVELKLVLVMQAGKLRAVPYKTGSKGMMMIVPGKLDKIEATKIIEEIIKEKYGYPITKEEIMGAIPSANIKIIK